MIEQAVQILNDESYTIEYVNYITRFCDLIKKENIFIKPYDENKGLFFKKLNLDQKQKRYFI